MVSLLISSRRTLVWRKSPMCSSSSRISSAPITWASWGTRPAHASPGCAGGPGRVFRNAWVANPCACPIAVPSAGRLPTAHSVIFNDRSLPRNANTFVRQFRAAGYRRRSGEIPPAAWAKPECGHALWGEGRSDPFTRDGTIEDEERYWASHPGGLLWLRAPGPVHRPRGTHVRAPSALGAEPGSGPALCDYDAGAGAHRSQHWCRSTSLLMGGTAFHALRRRGNHGGDSGRGGAGRALASLLLLSRSSPSLTPPGDWFFRHRPEDVAYRPPALIWRRRRRTASPGQYSSKGSAQLVAPCGYGDDALLRRPSRPPTA